MKLIPFIKYPPAKCSRPNHLIMFSLYDGLNPGLYKQFLYYIQLVNRPFLYYILLVVSYTYIYKNYLFHLVKRAKIII